MSSTAMSMFLTVRMKRHSRMYGVELWAGDIVTLPAADARALLSTRKAQHVLTDRYPTYGPAHGPREVVFRMGEQGHMEMQQQP